MSPSIVEGEREREIGGVRRRRRGGLRVRCWSEEVRCWDRRGEVLG